MCLMVYAGMRSTPPATDSAVLGFEPLEESEELVRQWFSLPQVWHIGVPAGNCSCGFRHVLADEPIDWYRSMWDERNDEELAADQAIVDVLRSVALRDGRLELYAVWAGNEAREPAWQVDRDFSWLDADQFFVQEDMFYCVSGSKR